MTDNDPSAADPLGQIADEFTQRLNRGEHPSIEEYANRHPEIAGLLREVLPALQLIRLPEMPATVASSGPNPDTELATPSGFCTNLV